MGGAEMKKDTQIIEVRAEQLADKIESLITEARQKIASVANTAQVYTYYEIGRYIIEDEQGGKVRAEYGKGVLKRVSERLTERLGKGWSVDTLENARNFYNIYAKSEPVVRKFDVSIDKIQTTSLEISSSTEIRHQAGDEIGQQVADQLDGEKKSQQVVDQIEVTEKSHQVGDQLEMPDTLGINPWSIISIFSPKTIGGMRYE